RALGGSNGGVPGTHNEIDLGVDEFPRDVSKSLGGLSVSTRVNFHHEAHPPQLLEKHDILRRTTRKGGQVAQAVRSARLLGAGGRRQKRDAEGERKLPKGGTP